MDDNSARDLAALLAESDDADVIRLLVERRITPSVSWHDWFDAAEALLDEGSVARSLTALSRPRLAELASGDGAARLGLTDPTGRPYAVVARVLGDDAFDPPVAREPVPAGEDEEAHAAERAFTETGAMADVLLSALRAPITRVGTGALGASGRRRLVQEGVVEDPDEAEHLIALGEDADLLRADGREWLVTVRGARWLQESSAQRWATLVDYLRDALPAGLRDGRGWTEPATWDAAYPLDSSWSARAERWRRHWRRTGLIAASGGEPAWARPARRGAEVDTAALTALLPHEVDKVFLQNDLTAISPGPLAPALDVRLRTMAIRESHAQASTYRFTDASVAAALTEGESAEGMSAFLETLSLTGVPQPLTYLIERTAERHGLVHVSLDQTSGHTVVSSRDHQLLDTIAVDQALRPLGLVADDRLLRTRVARDTVFWLLADARYPVVAIDDHGRTEKLRRQRLAPEHRDADPRFGYGPLLQRLRESYGDDADAAWLDRELDAAVRSRAMLVVDVALPDGSTREFTLEATGIGGGRLRGRDRGADVERTLPVTSIRKVRTLR